MLKHPNNTIGDAWFHVEGNTAHAFYLTCPREVPAHTAWDIGHATSTDLVNWTIHDLALRRGKGGSWDEMLATGSIVRTTDGYAMAYTSGLKAETGLAWSPDLYDWTRHSANPTSVCDERYYEARSAGLRKERHWRDPFIFRRDGRWQQIVCASRTGADGRSVGTLGWAVSDDLMSWTVLPPPEIQPFAEEMECPQILRRNGHFYLVFSAFPQLLLPEAESLVRAGGDWSATLSSLPWNLDKDVNRGPSAFVMVSSALRGPYVPATRPTLFCPDDPVQPYACQLVRFQGLDFCLGTIWAEDGTSYLSDPIRVIFEPGMIRAV